MLSNFSSQKPSTSMDNGNAPCYFACVRTTTWDRDRFGAVLEEIRTQAGLNLAQLGELAGRSKSQVSRWTRAENQPTFAAIQELSTAIAARYPQVADLARDLMDAAGYGGVGLGEFPATDTSEVKAAAPPVDSGVSAPAREPTWAEAMTSIERTMQTIAVAHQAIVERLESQDARTSNRFEAIDDRLGSDADRLEAIESRLSALEGSQSMSSGRERRKGA
jgi:transcriptional regulator with XRE-family HTH domain